MSELTLAFTLVPELIDRRFREEHERLWGSDWLRFDFNQVGKSVSASKELFSFMPVYTLIGKPFSMDTDPDIKVEHLVLAKDYVAGLSDSRARAFHRELFSGPANE